MTLTPQELEEGERLLEYWGERTGRCMTRSLEAWLRPRLTDLLASARALAEVTEERDALRLEVDRLPKANKQRLHKKATELRAERDALKAEVERLRRAADCHDAHLMETRCRRCGP